LFHRSYGSVQGGLRSELFLIVDALTDLFKLAYGAITRALAKRLCVPSPLERRLFTKRVPYSRCHCVEIPAATTARTAASAMVQVVQIDARIIKRYFALRIPQIGRRLLTMKACVSEQF
jgi:hypothetical protein